MFSSLRLGRVFGIDLFIHGTFWLLPAFIFFSGVMSGNTAGLAMDLAIVFVLFGCVALHELGHAFAARGYGVRTRDITLYPIGGVARLERMPEKPGPEIVIALAGPAVNVVIAAAIFAALVAFGPILVMTDPGMACAEFLSHILLLNVVLVLFNLIPAFPMDGGRVFRATMNLFTDRLTATKIAATVGAIAALGIGLYGLFTGSLMMMVLAGVVFMLGQAELAGTQAREDWKSRWNQRVYTTPFGGATPSQDPFSGTSVRVVRRPDGWEWDPVSRIWTEWRGGLPVRKLSAD
ncbi:MAG: site-2 protease family protein [Bacteroidales bacterium]|nr:site-2 protease family protein [Bacteroidales bacterium]